MSIPREQLVALLQSMLLMRRVEETVCELGPKEVFGNYHIYIGQEATGASVISLLRPEDAVFSTHRCHAHVVARGIPLEQVMGELMLRQTGASKGKGGTQHIMSLERRTVATSIVGGSTMLATGAAMAAQVMGGDWIPVAFLGERSLSEGVVPEVLNLAGLWDLPVLYVCENNNAEGPTNDPLQSHLNLAELINLPQTYGIVAKSVDGADPNAVYDAAAELVQRVRRERHPAFLESRTPPVPGRSRGEAASIDGIGATDLHRAWAPDPNDPVAVWRQSDPVLNTAKLALDAGVATKDEMLRMDQEIQEAVARATATARAAPLPSAAGAFEDIYAGGDLWPR